MLQLRAADLPRLHDDDARRHAMPGVRRRSHAGQNAPQHRAPAGAHDGADRDQRDRVPRRGQLLADRRAVGLGLRKRRAVRQPRRHPDARRRARAVVADRHRRLPAREPDPHRLQHVRALRARHHARAGARPPALRLDLRRSAADRLARRADRLAARRHRRRLRCGLRRDGRGRRRGARAPDPADAERRRRADPDQPDHQLHAARHLLGRAHRRLDRRRCSRP